MLVRIAYSLVRLTLFTHSRRQIDPSEITSLTLLINEWAAGADSLFIKELNGALHGAA